MDTSPVHPLTQDQAWDLLAANDFGRLAFAVAGIPDIVPINYCVYEGQLYFRTAAGSKLLGVTINAAIAFEIDEVLEDVATSVVVRGTATELTSGEDLDWADATLPLRPWVGTEKWHVVRITPEEVTGRSFDLIGRRAD